MTLIETINSLLSKYRMIRENLANTDKGQKPGCYIKGGTIHEIDAKRKPMALLDFACPFIKMLLCHNSEQSSVEHSGNPGT